MFNLSLDLDREIKSVGAKYRYRKLFILICKYIYRAESPSFRLLYFLAQFYIIIYRSSQQVIVNKSLISSAMFDRTVIFVIEQTSIFIGYILDWQQPMVWSFLMNRT